MMSEGTKTRDGEALSNALQLLGTTRLASASAARAARSASVARRQVRADARHPRRHAGELDVPAEALERLRAQRLVALTQAKAQPGAIAARVFPRVLYGDAHPYGQSSPRQSLKAITRDDVVAFHSAYFQPGRALVTVVGDVTPAAVKPVDREGAGRLAGRRRAAGVLVSRRCRRRRPTTIYLVDKPGAAQSTFAIGLPGPPRNTPDYYALQVMNTMLGGMFQSRLNANIREEKGYSYGVSSSFGFGKGPGPFRTGGDIVGDKTDAALVEFMKELRGILGEPAGHRRGAGDGEGRAGAAAARHVRVGQQRSTARSTALWVQGAAGRLLPAVREADRRGDQGGRAARREAVRRRRPPGDRDRRRPRR